MPATAQRWDAALAEHDAAAAAFAASARRIAPSQWHSPRAPGKWSPAEETVHLVQSYAAFAGELRGGPPLTLQGRWWQRLLLRLVIHPRILRTGRLPAGARAPRELRPDPPPDDREVLLATFETTVAEFVDALSAARQLSVRRYLTHPYFGRLPLLDALRFATVHTRHHHRYLPEPTPTGAIRA